MVFAEQIALRLAPFTKRLVDAFAVVCVQAVQIGVKGAIEALDIGISGRGRNFIDTDEIVIVVEKLVAAVPGRTQGNAPHGQGSLVLWL